MGLLDYYRQFEDMDEAESTGACASGAPASSALALEHVPERSTCPAPSGPTCPNSEVVNAAIARARGRVNGYPDRHAARLRRALAERHGITPEQIVVGNGAAELLQAAASRCSGRATSWSRPGPPTRSTR